MVPGENVAWDFTASPDAPQPSAYLKPSELVDQASTAKFEAKQSVELLGTGSGGVGQVGPITSIS